MVYLSVVFLEEYLIILSCNLTDVTVEHGLMYFGDRFTMLAINVTRIFCVTVIAFVFFRQFLRNRYWKSKLFSASLLSGCVFFQPNGEVLGPCIGVGAA